LASRFRPVIACRVSLLKNSIEADQIIGPVCLEEFGWFEGMLEEFMREKYGSG